MIKKNFYNCVLLILFLISEKAFAFDEWFQVDRTSQYDIYMSADQMKPKKTSNKKATKVEVWVKGVLRQNDLEYDRVIGDYAMMLTEFDCENKTLRHIQLISYSKDGKKVQYNHHYQKTLPEAIAPNTTGEIQSIIACNFLNMGALDKK